MVIVLACCCLITSRPDFIFAVVVDRIQFREGTGEGEEGKGKEGEKEEGTERRKNWKGKGMKRE